MIVSKRKKNLSEVAYQQIKDALCSGKIRPGEILSESQLAESLGMSRTPVREAIRALASEDWLEIHNGIGAYVKPLSSKDIEDLYEIRTLLEIQAAKTAIRHITNEDIDSLEQRFHEALADYKQNRNIDLRRFSDLDWEMHQLLVDRCQNNYIKNIMQTNSSNIRRYQSTSAEVLNDIEESILQHLDLLVLIRSRDLDSLLPALQRHLEWSSSLASQRP